MSNERNELIKEYWEYLVASAFDFFKKAISEFEKKPKYAVLHLATSVELFLKSRLMAEHWALLFANETKLSFDTFKSGDFKSVTVKDVIAKLNGILPANLQVSSDATKEFDKLAVERNKIVHFFHPSINNDKLQEVIVSQQCRVWYHLHLLIGTTWAKEYEPFMKDMKALVEKMKDQRRFLEQKYKLVEPEIDLLKKKKVKVYPCPSCEFDSLVVEPDQDIFNRSLCKVCDRNTIVLEVICPDCDTPNLLEYGDSSCGGYDDDKQDWCHHQFSPDELAKIFKLPRYSQDDFYYQDIYCPDCETGSVYQVEDSYVCLNCFASFKTISTCAWCNNYWAGELGEGTHYFGCGNCDGYAGHISDRDD